MLAVHLVLESYDQSLMLGIAPSDNSSDGLVHESRSSVGSIIRLWHHVDDVTVPIWSIHFVVSTWLWCDRFLGMH